MSRTILAIESSCDETAAAVLRGRDVLAECVASQFELHARFGGVVPEIASRRHLEQLDAVIADVLERSGVGEIEALDAIAVTQGPGLIGALLVGLAGAKARSWAGGVPLIAVDHLKGHVASAQLDELTPIEPPYLCLLASGGHTMLLDVDEGLELTLLGSTRDDAAGEAFDKGARLLGVEPASGASLAKLAERCDGDPGVQFTPAMVHHDTLDTSFSGIKTALAVAVRERDERGSSTPSDPQLAAAYELAIVETLVASVRKLLLARGPSSGHPAARDTLALVGGVAANTILRQHMTAICSQFDVRSAQAPLRWCGDNAVMIGVAAQHATEYVGRDAWTIDAYATSPLFRGR